MQPLTTKYPANATVVAISSPLELKAWWVFNEWSPLAQFSRHIQAQAARQEVLDPARCAENAGTINRVFYEIRGQYAAIWGEVREKARWRKVVVNELDIEWVRSSVEILHPNKNEFECSSLNGIVLWKDPGKNKYQLLEGNHRVCAWLKRSEPRFLPGILFIGKPQK